MPISLQEQTPCPVAPLQEDLRVTMRAANENAASSATSARNTKPPGAATTPQQAEIGLPDDTDDTPAAVPIMLEWPAASGDLESA